MGWGRPVQRRWTAIEATVPDRLTDDRCRLVIVGKPAAKNGSDAEHIPVVGGHHLRGDEFALAIDVQIRFHREGCGQSSERAAPGLEVSIRWIRECGDLTAVDSDILVSSVSRLP